MRTFALAPLSFFACAALLVAFNASSAEDEKHLLYVVVPGIRNYLEYGGEGILVYDIEKGHALLKRIPVSVTHDGKVENVKGVCANAAQKRLWFSTIKRLYCIDLISEKVLWEKPYPGGCDRMSLSPDGKVMYLPTLEGPHWHVIDALSGEIIAKVEPRSGAHNTVYGRDGTRAYLAGLKSPLLTVSDTKTHTILKTVGPFSAPIRPFTVNAAQTHCFVNVNDLLGFEIGEIETGKMLFRVEVDGYKRGIIKRHGCPSHGIGLAPDEKELWVCDAANSSMHIFDLSVMPPKQAASVKCSDQPGWITFGLDGRYAYPSTCDVIDTKTRTILTSLKDENGKPVQSEKLLQIDFAAGVPVRAGDQFGFGRLK